MCFLFFFFKQKTAYDMRISDWSSDVCSSDLFGTAVGGSLGAHKEQMYEVVSYCMPHVAPDRPVHLLGIGGIGDIFAGVRLGIDTFDCVSPTRVARHGWALVKGAESDRINLRNARFRQDAEPIDGTCGCHTCRTCSRAFPPPLT